MGEQQLQQEELQVGMISGVTNFQLVVA